MRSQLSSVRAFRLNCVAQKDLTARSNATIGFPPSRSGPVGTSLP
jgi:hypothetical protein